MLSGGALGIVNAFLVNQVRINSFIATLVSSIVFRGAAILVTGGLIVTVRDKSFRTLGTERLWDAKYSVYVYALFVAVTWFLLTWAVLGVLILAMIGNGFNLLSIDTTYQQIVQGFLIMVAVGADQLLRRRR
jgi:ribose transport system permease protein